MVHRAKSSYIFQRLQWPNLDMSKKTIIANNNQDNFEGFKLGTRGTRDKNSKVFHVHILIYIFKVGLP